MVNNVTRSHNKFISGMGITLVLLLIIMLGMTNPQNYEKSEASENELKPKVSAGENHTVILKNDGTVWAFGSNSRGQLGANKEITGSEVPIQVSGLTKIIDISAGGNHTLALQSDGTVWAWGANESGQCGNGSFSDIYKPESMKKCGFSKWRYDIEPVKAIAAGKAHSVIVYRDPEPVPGTVQNDPMVWTCGNNEHGQLGLDSTESMAIPTAVELHTLNLTFLSDVDSVVAGDFHTIALGKSTNMYSFGSNSNGQLGSYHLAFKTVLYTDQLYPQNVYYDSELQDIVVGNNVNLIGAGGNNSVALRKDGTVWAWGANESGQIGIGSYKQMPLQTEVATLSNKGIVNICCGKSYTIALDEDGFVWTWGNAPNKGTGITDKIMATIPTKFQKISDVIGIAAGSGHAAAIKKDGSVWTWGDNASGQLGTGNSARANSPEQIEGFNVFN